MAKRRIPVNKGIAAVQKKGSKIITEGYHMLPAASLLISAGVIKKVSDRKKPFITVVNSYTTHKSIKTLKQNSWNYLNLAKS